MAHQNKIDPIPFYKTVTTADTEKPWITMVHGASQHSAIFSAQIHFFQQHYRLLLIDLPGHGKSSSMPGPFGLHEYAASILAAMDDAGVMETHYWGTHTGTGAGLLLAAKHPKRFHSLVLEGVVLPGVDVRSITDTVGRAKATARDCGIAIARKEWFETAGWFAVMRNHPEQCRAAEQWQIISEFSGAPWLDSGMAQPVSLIVDRAAISMPVLLINGQYDLPDFLQMANDLAAELSDVQQVIIPEAGGFPLWEFPERVNESVFHFLERQRKDLK